MAIQSTRCSSFRRQVEGRGEVYQVPSPTSCGRYDSYILCPKNDPADTRALTPAHFLIGESLAVVPEPSLSDVQTSRLSRWQQLRQMMVHRISSTTAGHRQVAAPLSPNYSELSRSHSR